MTTTAIRTKVHQYIDDADSSILEVVYKLLEVYRKGNESYLSAEQKNIVEETSALYKASKIKGYSISEAKSRIKQKFKK